MFYNDVMVKVTSAIKLSVREQNNKCIQRVCFWQYCKETYLKYNNIQFFE